MSPLFMTLITSLLLTGPGCPISNLTETTFTFNGSSSQRYLYLADCQIEHIAQGAFKLTPHLRQLNLRGNLIPELSKSSFEGLGSLTKLDLSWNLLTSLPDDVLHFMPSLQKLILSNNPIIDISGKALRSSNLSYLYIKDNLVPLTLASGALADMSHLIHLEISNCSVTTLPSDLLKNSNAVKEINLIFNHIKYLPEEIFEHKTNLEILYIFNNQLHELSPSTFASLKSLFLLDLDNNEISDINANTLSSLELIILYMRGNRLCEIPQDAFPDSLKILHLDNNELTTLEIRPLPVLSVLQFTNNLLSSVPQQWSVMFPALHSVDLSNNSFTQLSESDMAVLSQYPLASFNFKNNKIVTVLVDQRTNETAELWFEGAPLRCDCSMHGFATHFRKYTNKVREAYCAEPVSLKSTSLTEVPLIDFVCHLEPCPDTCTCVVRPEMKTLQVKCRVQLTAEQVTELETLRRQHYSKITQNTTISYTAHH